MSSESIYFITGNKDKFVEVEGMLGMPLVQLSIDLPEIQSLDAKEVVKHKLLVAKGQVKGTYIVEDTSLCLGCMENKLPGPFIKWFEKTMGIEGIALLADRLGNTYAEARTVIGCVESNGGMHFFEGALRGNIVLPRGANDFGWGPIFVPEGHTKTFGEMTREEKHAISMRSVAVKKMREFFDRQ